MKRINTLKGHTGAVNVAVFNKGGDYVATGGADKTVKLWNPASALCVKTYTGHGYEVLDIAISSDNAKFTSVGGDKAALLWDVGTGKVIRRFTGHAARINSCAFNADATVIVTGSYDATVKFWDCRAQTYTPIQTLSDAKDSVSSIHLTAQEILTGSIDGKLRVYDIRMGMCTVDDVGHSITSARFSNDENCMLVSSLDGTIRLFDKENGEMLASYKGHKNTDYKVISTLSNDDAHVLSGSEDGRICVWDLVEGDMVETIAAHGSGATGRLVTCVAYHPKEDAFTQGVKSIWDMGLDVFRLAFLVFSRAPNGLVNIRKYFGDYIAKVGLSIVNDVNRDPTMILNLIAFKKRMETLTNTTFASSKEFMLVIRESFEKFIHKRHNKPAELIAKTCRFTHENGEGNTETETEEVLDQCLALFRFIHAKDVFEAFYKKDLAKRLLLGKSSSVDSDKSMLAKLKVE
ncbi:Cullin-4B [Chytriomyces hyalinus]|nr:Cullin-4B [Chytriomyces hyalinus]